MTVGWIFEGDRDRFLAARDRIQVRSTSHERYRCPFCDADFAKRAQLNLHLQSSHTVMRPFVLLGGVEPGTEDVIRTRLDARSIDFFHCSELELGIDGEMLRQVDQAELTKVLSKLSRATIRLRLLNCVDRRAQPVSQDYRLRIAIPDQNSLAEIDRLFVDRLGKGHRDLAHVDAFYELTRDGVAAEYAEALADYVRAVLIKDGDTNTGVSTRVSHYREIQSRALSTLQSFDRPLAVLLCALIRFSQNDFSLWNCVSGFDRLDQANGILGPLVLDSAKPNNPPPIAATRRTRVFDCPVDLGVDTVTREAERLADLPRWGRAIEDQVTALADQVSLDPLDRAKIRALWAVTAMRLAANASAVTALRLLDGDPTFGRWAVARLTEIDA